LKALALAVTEIHLGMSNYTTSSAAEDRLHVAMCQSKSAAFASEPEMPFTRMSLAVNECLCVFVYAHKHSFTANKILINGIFGLLANAVAVNLPNVCYIHCMSENNS